MSDQGNQTPQPAPPGKAAARLELAVPPLAVLSIFAGLAWLLEAALPGLKAGHPFALWLGAGIALGGVAVTVAGVLAFRRARTTVDPTRPHRSTTIVTGGIYRLTRNPMYLGFALMLLGLAVGLAHAGALATVPAFVCYMNRFQIAPEERALHARFGAAFESYRRRVRRWI